MVSAWSAANGISLGQVKVDDKSSEITAIPLLINSLELSGCIVTIDAMGCQKDITQTIIGHDANYIIYNPQIQISAESGTKRSNFRQKDKTKRSKKRLHTTLIKPEQKVNEDLCSGFIVS